MSLAQVVKNKNELLPMMSTKSASLSCVEWSLRCLAMSDMIQAGMFRRNGDAVLNMNHNYLRPPLTYTLRDLDVRSVRYVRVRCVRLVSQTSKTKHRSSSEY